jgi:hypothetical protein
MEADLNKYDLEHACTAHPRMTKTEWDAAYAGAWTRYYSDAHVETLMRRAVACGSHPAQFLHTLVAFSGAVRIEGVHPLQLGLFRRKIRKQRRSGLPIMNPLLFYPWRFCGFVKTTAQWLSLAWRYRKILSRVMADPAARSYTDRALSQRGDHETDDLVAIFADVIPPAYGARRPRTAVRTRASAAP